MHALDLSFQQTQKEFCDWIRKPDSVILHDPLPSRMQLYRDLLFGNVCSFIDLVYPVAHALLGEKTWQGLCEEFFQKARCQSPFYNDISLQFREYLVEVQHPVLAEYPWLAELLQFEWLELYLDITEIEPRKWVDNSALLQLTQQVWILVYQYPVYLWSYETKQEEIELAPSAVMVWRDHFDQVRTVPISPMFAMLVELLEQQALTQVQLQEHLQQNLPDFPADQAAEYIHELSVLLKELNLLAAHD